VVERSPEKAGVGGSTPSLATTFSIVYQIGLKFHTCDFTPVVGIEPADLFHAI
jgi:hypothetical protein